MQMSGIWFVTYSALIQGLKDDVKEKKVGRRLSQVAHPTAVTLPAAGCAVLLAAPPTRLLQDVADWCNTVPCPLPPALLTSRAAAPLQI